MSARHTVADAIVAALDRRGVDTVFGIPGVHNLALFEALDRAGLRTIVVRHEATAAYAADAYGRLTGRPGVCLTTSGPGAANAAAAMGEAQASRSPLLHLTTTVARRHLGMEVSRGVLHEHPRQRDILDPVSKRAAVAGEPVAVASVIESMLDLAAEPTPGPVYVEVPTDVLAEPAPQQPAATPAAAGRPQAPARPALREIATRLEAAERPLLWVGSGGAASAPEILELAERLGAPVVLTHSAKRAWSAGAGPLVLRHPPHEPPVAALCSQSDAVLVLGSDLDGMMTQEFRLPLTGILRVEADPQRIDVPYPSAIGVIGDAGAVVRDLVALVARRGRAGWGAAAVARADGEAAKALAGEPDAAPGLGYVAALDEAIGDLRVVVACDMAISGYWTAGYLPLRPTRRVIYPVGWGTLGFALPASIGAVRAGAGRAIVVCGDGGALFAIGELATIAQEQLPVTVVVQTDGGYGMLRYDEERMFDRTFAVDLEPPGFPELARSFGLPAERVACEAGALQAALARALDRPGPALIEVTGRLTPPRITSPRWPLAAGH